MICFFYFVEQKLVQTNGGIVNARIQKKYRTITEEFKAIGDICGTFAQIPTYNQLQLHTPGTVKKKEKLMRWMKHLQRSTDKLIDFASINNRKQSVTTPTVTRIRI